MANNSRAGDLDEDGRGTEIAGGKKQAQKGMKITDTRPTWAANKYTAIRVFEDVSCREFATKR
jgi:hypothetical protein